MTVILKKSFVLYLIEKLGLKENKNMGNLNIAGRRIGDGAPPYVIAEMSANHNGSIEQAYRLIEAAQAAGADAVKMQTYTPDTITLNCSTEDFQIRGGLWNGRTLYDLYQQAHMPWQWHKPLFEHARQLGITAFSSPFDTTAVDLLEDLGAPAYKIASFEAVDLSLIKYAAATGKPLIISTGMANNEEIKEAVDAARSAGCRELALLHCVSGYPAPADEYNLRTIPDMANRYGVVIGLSDHTLGNATAIASVALGACLIEKHFTLDRNGGGPDDSFSLEPAELTALCRDARTAWDAIGSVNYSRTVSEVENIKFRRSIYASQDIAAGEVLTTRNIRIVRPGFGLAPKHYENLLGRRANCDMHVGTALAWSYIQDTETK
jgi:pseudaminic acid synthase